VEFDKLLQFHYSFLIINKVTNAVRCQSTEILMKQNPEYDNIFTKYSIHIKVDVAIKLYGDY
jgi:hypothetical protein